MKSPPNHFRLQLTADFYDSTGQPKFMDLGLDTFTNHSHIQVGQFQEHLPEITTEQLQDCHGAIVLTPQVTRHTVSQTDNLLGLCRFGVGYDNVDVDACTAAEVLVMITSGAVDRPVAEATIGWMLALTHHMLTKDRIVRDGTWDERTAYMGCELRDRTLGVIGLGGIGQQLISLLAGFGMQQPIAFDPFLPADVYAELGVRSVSLEELLGSADFVSLHCPLNDHTAGLIGTNQLALMKPDAYLINTARGGIVDEDALFNALKNRRIAGAALDCFDMEPVVKPHRFGQLKNVILAPHSIAWTGELFRDIGQTACQIMLDLSTGKQPSGVLNPDLLKRPSFREKWQRITGMEIS